MKKIYILISIFLIVLLCLTRLYKLDSYPSSPYWEEVALGYDAYSILKTGKDHHGNPFPIVAFESFGDWKPSLYFYVIIPFLLIFDLSVMAVRLPAAISGIMTVIGIAAITSLIYSQLEEKKKSVHVFLISLSIATISMWGIMFSRAGWEGMLATALVTWGVFFGLKSLLIMAHTQMRVSFLLSTTLLSLSLYAYHSARIVAPLVGLIIVILHFQKIFKNKKVVSSLKSYIPGVFISVILLIPLLINLNNQNIQHRFSETSIFSDISVIEESNNLKEIAGNSLISRVMYHRYLLFSREIIGNFLSHFTLDYLFISGDSNPRHSSQFMGIFYPTEIIGLCFGILFLIRKKTKFTLLLIGWIIIGTIPASITFAAPHALRTLLTFPAYMIIISFGWLYAYEMLEEKLLKYPKKRFLIRNVLVGAIIVSYTVQFLIFWRFYTKIYPTIHSSDWQYGYKELYETVDSLQKQDPNTQFYITRDQGRPAMYYWFYTKENPEFVQTANSIKKDQSEFLNYKNFSFITNSPSIKSKNSVVILGLSEYGALRDEGTTNFSLIKTIKNKKNESIFFVGKYE